MSFTASSLRFESVSLETLDGDGHPTTILRDVDLDVPLVGITVLVGPSGSGKSTVLRLCNRLEAPSSGRVLLDGEDLALSDPLALRRRVGMVFQRPAVFGGTVRDNCREAERTADDDRIGAMLERCGLDAGYLYRNADDLSGGEAQRMCLARTLLTDPQVVLMDEVTSSLDPEHRDVIEVLARALADDGIAVLWVTHDLDQARRLRDRSLVILDGTVASGDAAERFLVDGSTTPEGG